MGISFYAYRSENFHLHSWLKVRTLRGLSKTSILVGFSHFLTTSEVCLGSLSCWNTPIAPKTQSFSDDFGFSWRISEIILRLRCSICFLLSSRSTGSKTTPQHHTIILLLLDSRDGVLCVKGLTFSPPHMLLLIVAKQLISSDHRTFLSSIFDSDFPDLFR